MIKERAVLEFDPNQVGGEIKEIFSDELARTLWIAIKRTHIVDQYFNSFILAAAKKIRDIRKAGVLSSNEFFDILANRSGPWHGSGVIGEDERDFADELYPFVLGVKQITYEIKTQ